MTMQSEKLINWKKWPYWVRGGIIIDMLFLLAGVSLVLFGGAMIHTPLYFLVLMPADSIIALIVRRGGLIEPSLESISFSRNVYLLILLSIIIYFFIGAMVGRLYDKIKNKDKSK